MSVIASKLILKKSNSRPLFHLLSVSPNSNTIVLQINVTNGASCIRRWDSNSPPLGHWSPPITTRPEIIITDAYLLLALASEAVTIVFGACPCRKDLNKADLK